MRTVTLENRLKVVQDVPGVSRWDALRAACPTLTEWGLRTLKSGLDAFAQSIVLEPHYICKDHRNLHSNFYSKKFQEHSSDCARLHFFSRARLSIGELMFQTASLQPEYLGYSVIRPVRDRCLGRTVIDPQRVGRRVEDGFYTLRTAFEARPNGLRLAAHGYPYMSQDGEAIICAHTALWGLCRYFSERYTTYAEQYPYDLITMTTDTQGRVVPYRGLTYADYSRILVNFGRHPEILAIKLKETDPDLGGEKFLHLCSYVESGFPVLASFFGHVVTIVGHTMDRQRRPAPDPNGLMDSSAFLRQFIVVDDNFFPYQLLGYRDDPANYGSAYHQHPYHIGSIRVAVCPLPEKVYLPSEKARALFTSLLKSLLQRPRIARALRAGTDDALVTRLLITTSSAFKRRKLEKGVQGGQVLDPISVKVAGLHLPHFVWLMEVAPVSSYLAGRCTGEVVLDATANQMEEGLLYARAGDILLLNQQELRVKNRPVDLMTFAQYTHNLGEQ